MQTYQLILASQSPRRKEIFSWFHIPYKVSPADIDEELPIDDHQDYVQQVALAKAQVVFDKFADGNFSSPIMVVGADTTVALDNERFGKPTNIQDAKRMLKLLSGKTHQVYTGVSILWTENNKKNQTLLVEKTDVTFGVINNQLLEQYLLTKDSLDKAGAYGVQGMAQAFIERIHGSYANVVGFPANQFLQWLDQKWENGQWHGKFK